jgi:hypothetical protein
MLFQSSDRDPPIGFSSPGKVAGSRATIVVGLSEFFSADIMLLTLSLGHALFQALGGGWWNREDLPEQHIVNVGTGEADVLADQPSDLISAL